MVLGYAAGQKPECQYSLMVELWHSDGAGVSECHKPQLRELWNSEHGKSLKGLCLSAIPSIHRNCLTVQSAINIFIRYGIGILEL